MNYENTKRSLALAFVALLIIGRPSHAVPITYSDTSTDASISLGENSFSCDLATYNGCANLTITAQGDTSTVLPFSVTGAHGYSNLVTSASLSADVDVNGVYVHYHANFVGPIPFFVTVDNQNFGAGFGTRCPGCGSGYPNMANGSPTYPEATFGNVGFATYNLASNIVAEGFWPFCAVLTACDTPPVLSTDAGNFTVMGLGPSFSVFSSTVTEVPEPSMGWILAAPLVAGSFLRINRQTRRA